MAKNNKDLVSIVISYYNLGKYIKETVESCIKQTYRNIEIILVNDGSNDLDSLKVLEKLKQKYKKKILFIDTENQGLSSARNTGIKASRGTFVCCMDADDKIDKSYIEKLHSAIASDQNIGIASSWVRLFGAQRGIWKTEKMSLDRALNRNTICGSSLFRKVCWNEVGGYDENMKSGYEDWDFWISITKKGYTSIIVPAPLFKYRIRPHSMLSSSNSKRMEIIKYLSSKHQDLLNKYSKEIYLYAEADLDYSRKQIIAQKNIISNFNKKSTKLEKKNIYLEQLMAELNQIKNSLSWKVIMFIRLKILDKILPQRQRYMPGIKSRLKKLKNKLSLTNKIKITLPFKQKKWPSNKPLVSVIIPCYNYGRYIHEAVDSVLKQTFQNFEIIIVESNSTDNSRSIIKLIKGEKIVKLYRNENHLAGDNRNYGISKANGKYICCLDPDDILKPTYLEKAIFILETQNYDLVSTSIETFGTESKIYYQIPNPTLSDMTQANHVSTVAVFKKHFWKKANGYHDYGTGDNYVYEDWDLWLRISALGARFYNINEPLMLYRLHGSDSLSSNIKNKSREEQKAKIIEYNQQLLGTINILQSKINNKILHYRVINKYVNLLNKTQPVDILFALPFTALGGADKIFLNLINLLKDNGITSLISTTVHFNNSIHDTSSAYEKITSLIFHLPRFLENQSLQKDFIDYLLQVYKVKIIFIGGSQLFYNNLEYIKHAYPQVKIVDIQFNTDIHFKNALQNKKNIDRIIAENQTVYDEFVKVQRFDPKTVDLISYGVETNILKPGKNSKKLPSSIPKNKFIISYIGRLSEEKNPGFMIKLAQKYKNNDKLFFVLAGPGNMFDKLQREINSLNLKNIFMPGTISSAEYLSFTDVLLLPSKIDGNPIIIKEAFSMAVPVVASNVGGVPYLVKNNETGFICKIDDIKSFSSSLDKIISSPTLLQKMKKNCRSYAIENLDIESVNKKFLKVFKEEIIK